MTHTTNCPHCNGRLTKTGDYEDYACRQCGRKLRPVVVERIDAFKRVANNDGPAADIAKAALDGR